MFYVHKDWSIVSPHNMSIYQIFIRQLTMSNWHGGCWNETCSGIYLGRGIEAVENGPVVDVAGIYLIQQMDPSTKYYLDLLVLHEGVKHFVSWFHLSSPYIKLLCFPTWYTQGFRLLAKPHALRTWWFTDQVSLKENGLVCINFIVI
jgi:hypothetical protein